MKAKQLSLGFLVSLLVLITSSQVFAKAPPVAKLVQIEGQVEYSGVQNTCFPVITSERAKTVPGCSSTRRLACPRNWVRTARLRLMVLR